MLHLIPGKLGHLFVVISFVAAIASSVAYLLSLKNEDSKNPLRSFGRVLFFIHGIAALGVIASLFYIIYNHYYEYHYAWSHSANNLPAYYMISCFWEGQEGSFLLWIFWHVILGTSLIFIHPKWEAPTMAVFAMVQAFLASMILGVIIPGIELKIGSSPFILLREFMQDAPIFQTNPDFIPEDGTGLNPLLQNYWMVIHPPVTFLGFASCLIPFSFMLGGLLKGQVKEWVPLALPWALFGTMFLGLGIMMGGYWAYETLNFGGYWNWDPVENAVYIPWLVLVASVHSLFTTRSGGKGLKLSMILVATTFILVLYSTFLTRSGILGDTSVHSFTDLGLSGQLLIYLLFFTGLSVVAISRAWNKIEKNKNEVSTYSREFWIFSGVTVLTLASFQVFMTTSIPVFNAIIEGIGVKTNFAPPADPMEHYGNAQIWFAMGVAILSAVGPFFWWNKMDWKKLKDLATAPLVLTLIGSAIILLVWGISNISYILLLTTAFFSILANVFTLQKLNKAGLRLTGGSLAHIGLAIVFIGILFSAGYSRVVSQNVTGKIYHEDFPDDLNLKNVLLWRGKSIPMGDLTLTYLGPRMESRKGGFMLDRDQLIRTNDMDLMILDYDPSPPADILGKSGDSVRVFGENNYFEVLFENKNGKQFTLFPRGQINEDMGGLIASPDIKKYFSKDLYTHVSSFVNPTEDPDWTIEETIRVSVGDTLFLKDHPAIFEGVETVREIAGHKLEGEDIGIEAELRVFTPGGEISLVPLFIIHDQMIGRVPDEDLGIGVKVLITNIIPEENIFEIQVQGTQPDYVILKAMEKPWINLLWGGTLLCLGGIFLAMRRRFKELTS